MEKPYICLSEKHPKKPSNHEISQHVPPASLRLADRFRTDGQHRLRSDRQHARLLPPDETTAYLPPRLGNGGRNGLRRVESPRPQPADGMYGEHPAGTGGIRPGSDRPRTPRRLRSAQDCVQPLRMVPRAGLSAGTRRTGPLPRHRPASRPRRPLLHRQGKDGTPLPRRSRNHERRRPMGRPIL